MPEYSGIDERSNFGVCSFVGFTVAFVVIYLHFAEYSFLFVSDDVSKAVDTQPPNTDSAIAPANNKILFLFIVISFLFYKLIFFKYSSVISGCEKPLKSELETSVNLLNRMQTLHLTGIFGSNENY